MTRDQIKTAVQFGLDGAGCDADVVEDVTAAVWAVVEDDAPHDIFQRLIQHCRPDKDQGLSDAEESVWRDVDSLIDGQAKGRSGRTHWHGNRSTCCGSDKPEPGRDPGYLWCHWRQENHDPRWYCADWTGKDKESG